MAITTTEFIAECRYIFDMLKQDAQEDTEGTFIWEGSLTRWFSAKDISIDKYNKLMQHLKAMGSVEVISSGNRWAPTMLKLNDPPTVELYMKANSMGKFDKRTTRASAVDQTLQDYGDRITALESLVNQLIEAQINA